MRIFRSLVIAFSMYSAIWVPQFEWKEEDMRYVFCFFPWIGAVIGGSVYLWCYVCGIYRIGPVCRSVIGMSIPLFLTGGFHVDGFMDTMDAFHSYQPRERKLEILKDSHIGAFAVIMLAAYGLVYLGAFSEVRDERLLKIVCSGFFLSRCLSGIGAVFFPKAKKEGTLSIFAGSAQKRTVKLSLYLQAFACIGMELSWSFGFGLCVVSAAFLAFVYYYVRCRKEFGGITGDTAGYFVLLCEICMLLTAAGIDIFG